MKEQTTFADNLTGLALIAVLWQAQARAQPARQQEGKPDVKARARGHRKAVRSVVKRQHFALRPRARMRQRALVYEPFIAAAARKYVVDPRVLCPIAYLETRFRADQTSPNDATARYVQVAEQWPPGAYLALPSHRGCNLAYIPLTSGRSTSTNQRGQR